MNDHYGGIVHKDRMRTMYQEAESSRQAASAREHQTTRQGGWLRGSRLRIAALVAAILPTSGR